ncbi:MAG: hypothetical protein JSU74_11975 [Candidatus Zixiibacteriota bacterium]|nr:MAG: hypothetical protein JSU74_11975 [candidate division Zixibacteria bacterium]
MKSEMDLLGMNSHDRLHWLKANRITLMAVGLVWIGMIVQRVLTGSIPWFLIAMVFVFAGLRLVSYLLYKRSAD